MQTEAERAKIEDDRRILNEIDKLCFFCNFDRMKILFSIDFDFYALLISGIGFNLIYIYKQ